MPTCSICKQQKNTHADNMSATLSGTLICSSCLSAHTESSTQKLISLKEQLSSATFERRSRGFFSTLFGGNGVEINIEHLESEVYQEKLTIVLRNTLAETITTYPPDWELRRDVVKSAHSNTCKKCHTRNNTVFHVHHIRPLARGGTNKLDNLELLCAHCHSKEHGGRNFQAENSDSETALTKRIKATHEAIAQGKKISFGYKKGGEKEYTRRRIQPTSIVTVQRRDGSSSVCVVGFCFTRNADRQFAISKMNRLTILKT